jgi:signal transduction histidine kinase
MQKTSRRSAGKRRGPSIRRRIYFLVAIPLLTVFGLYGFLLYTTVGDAINLGRTPDLINVTSVPAAIFDSYIQSERRASLMYLAAPTAADRAQLTAAQNATEQALPAFHATMSSPATTRTATTSELAVIHTMLADVNHLSVTRAQVNARQISLTQAFSVYSRVLTDELALFIQENASLTNPFAITQSLAVIDTAEAREVLLQEDALISASIAAHGLTPAVRIEFTQLAGARKAIIQGAVSRLDPGDLAIFNAQMAKYAPAAAVAALPKLELAVAADPTPVPPFSATQWEPVAQANAAGYFWGGVRAVEYQVDRNTQNANAAWRRVALAGGLGLLGLILSILVSWLIGRRIIRRLGRLRESADMLAHEQLPDVVARLRRGDDVPVEEMTGPTTELGRDEIGQVGEAFDAARHTAIEAAVGEARMRRGISDVFRNLARRNQSLLHRQLTALDQMERRTTDPEMLEELFRLDHLTTRMRRHAEGLIILSGAAPGRGWVHPVRMVDVLRGAAAEVEDYSRVTVTCPSQAALQGPAVADVIHLLAELIENATTLSPPYTPVRVSGDLVANGFAVEIEDRGLGMSEQRLAELNARLAEPPEFDVFHSEQLGLFVVGQLAKRHGIRVTLRPSPFGGTTVIALIPTELVGVEESYLEGLPAGMSAVSSWSADRQTAGDDLMVQAGAQRTQLTGGQAWGALPQGAQGAQGAQANASPGPAAPAGPTGPTAPGQPDPFDAFTPVWPKPATETTQEPNGSGTAAADDGEPHFPKDPYASQPYSGYGTQSYGTGPSYPSFGSPAETGSGETGTGRPWPYDREPPGSPSGSGASFNGPSSNSPSFSGPSFNGTGQPDAGGTRPWYPQAESPFPATRSPYPEAEPAAPSPAADASGASDTSSEPATAPQPAYPSGGEESYKGLPRRVRQASLAPQLRDRSANRPAPAGESAPERSPEQIRSALSAIQRGWQEARTDGSPAGDAPGQAPSAAGTPADDTQPHSGPAGRTTDTSRDTDRPTTSDSEEQSHLGGSDDA